LQLYRWIWIYGRVRGDRDGFTALWWTRRRKVGEGKDAGDDEGDIE
jgi:hypothetical protein